MPIQTWYPKRLPRQADVWTGRFDDLPAEWRRLAALRTAPNHGLIVQTVHGPVRAEVGDYIARDLSGTFYPVKPATWLATYERDWDGTVPDDREVP